MLHSRLRPLPRPRQNLTTATAKDVPAPSPDFANEDENEVEEDPESLFGAFLPHLFPDDAPQFHGDPGQHLLYSSAAFGDLRIMVPSYPGQDNGSSEEGRRLFAHLVWSAALVVAEGVENAYLYETDPTAVRKEALELWNMKDQSVLELGAGAAVPSLISTLANASKVVATDHPSSPALSGAIQFNMDYNLRNHSPTPAARPLVQPHEWGKLDDSFAQQNKGAFTRIIAADCYWMRDQHENLARTMQWFLAPGGQVNIVTGFHTGRTIVADFFKTACKNGFKIDRIFERDLLAQDEDGRDIRREWLPEREGEGPENRRRWCVIAVLKRDE